MHRVSQLNARYLVRLGRSEAGLTFALQTNMKLAVPSREKVFELLRSLLAGGAATLADLAVLTLLVTVLHWSPRDANLPALLTGGVVNFFGNRHFAFRARGDLQKHVVGYTLVEIVALALNGVLYDVILRMLPGAAHLYWLVRLATSNAVFLCWSYPLWRRVFRSARPSEAHAS